MLAEPWETQFIWLGTLRQICKIDLTGLQQHNFPGVSFYATVCDLGVTLKLELTFSDHVGRVCLICFYHMYQIRMIHRSVTTKTPMSIIFSISSFMAHAMPLHASAAHLWLLSTLSCPASCMWPPVVSNAVLCSSLWSCWYIVSFVFHSFWFHDHCTYIHTCTGLKTCHMSFLAFVFNHILHCMYFKILFTESKYLVSNWGYTRLIRTIKKVKESNKNVKIFRVIIILCNHHFILLKLFWAIKGFILYQINQPALKSSGYNFTTYSKFTDTSWIEELQTRKPSLL